MTVAPLPFESSVLEFVDGHQFLIHDPDMFEYSVLVHRETMSLLHGSRLDVTPDPQTGFNSFTFGDRSLGICPDRASFLMAIAANAEVGEVDATEEATEQFQLMLAAMQRPEPTNAGSGHKALTFKARVAPGVAVHQLPIGPWTATPQHILDRNGELAYARVGQVLPARAEPTPETSSFLSGLRSLFGRRK